MLHQRQRKGKVVNCRRGLFLPFVSLTGCKRFKKNAVMEIYSYTNAFGVDAEPLLWPCCASLIKSYLKLSTYLRSIKKNCTENPQALCQMFLAHVCVCTCAFLCQKPLRAICFPPCSVSLSAYHLHVASTALRSKPPKSDKPGSAAHANESESLTPSVSTGPD